MSENSEKRLWNEVAKQLEDIQEDNKDDEDDEWIRMQTTGWSRDLTSDINSFIMSLSTITKQ